MLYIPTVNICTDVDINAIVPMFDAVDTGEIRVSPYSKRSRKPKRLFGEEALMSATVPTTKRPKSFKTSSRRSIG
eukprot:scaffold5084_cov96-Alexandrium_tamarense.AAC.2